MAWSGRRVGAGGGRADALPAAAVGDSCGIWNALFLCNAGADHRLAAQLQGWPIDPFSRFCTRYPRRTSQNHEHEAPVQARGTYPGPDDIIAAGVLRCAAVLDLSPMGSTDANHAPVGGDVAPCDAQVAALGVEPAYVAPP